MPPAVPLYVTCFHHTRVESVPVLTPFVHLQFDTETARVLAAILNRVGGNPALNAAGMSTMQVDEPGAVIQPRGRMDALRAALVKDHRQLCDERGLVVPSCARAIYINYQGAPNSEVRESAIVFLPSPALAATPGCQCPECRQARDAEQKRAHT